MRIRRGLVALALLVSSAPLAAASNGTRPFSLDEVLSFPYPSELAAAEGSPRVAWTVEARGERSAWAAEGPDYRPREIWSSGGDDGRQVSHLALSRDGAVVVFVRGGDPDANWHVSPPPSPDHSTDLPKIEILAVPFAGGAAKVLGEGFEPTVSPKGDRVAFVHDHEIWAAPIDGSKPASRLFFDRGELDWPAWSPDGSKLAFVSGRGDHAFIGVFSGEKEPIRYLAPAAAKDTYPVWSPDGSRIAFVRRRADGGAPEPFLEPRPEPWEIWVADPSTGAGRPVWEGPETRPGSYPDRRGGANLHWLAGDRLLFLAELDGWPHLYSVSAAGGAPVLLTPGKLMVEDVAVSPDGSAVVFNANAGRDAADDDRRHLFRVSADRADASALTSGGGIEWAPVIPGGGKTVVFIGAGTRTPPRAMRIAAAGSAPSEIGGPPIPPNFPAKSFVEPRKVVFRSEDGLEIHGQLFEATGGPARRPALIFVHGGPPRQMLLGWHYMYYYANAYAMNQYLASRGYAAMTVNYRLGIGYGSAFHDPEHAGPWGASEYRDVLAAAKHLQSRPEVDSTRIGIWGGSYGGYLTALALARDSGIFKAGVDWHGVHDWIAAFNRYGGFFKEAQLRYEKGDVFRAMDVAWKSSPVSSVSTWRSPVLLIQGDDDRNVEIHQTIDLARRLDAAGVEHEVILIPDEIHDFLRYASWLRVEEATAEFLDRKLKP